MRGRARAGYVAVNKVCGPPRSQKVDPSAADAPFRITNEVQPDWLVVASGASRFRFSPNLTLHLHYVNKSQFKKTQKLQCV